MFWQHIEKRLVCLPCYRVLAAMSWQEYKWKLLRKRRVCRPWIWNYFIVCLFVFPGQDQTAWTSMVEQIFSGRCWRFWKGNMQRKWLKKVWGKITRVSTGGTCSDVATFIVTMFMNSVFRIWLSKWYSYIISARNYLPCFR